MEWPWKDRVHGWFAQVPSWTFPLLTNVRYTSFIRVFFLKPDRYAFCSSYNFQDLPIAFICPHWHRGQSLHILPYNSLSINIFDFEPVCLLRPALLLLLTPGLCNLHQMNFLCATASSSVNVVVYTIVPTLYWLFSLTSVQPCFSMLLEQPF